MMLAKFTEMIGILRNNFLGILLRSAVFNLSALLLLLFKISVKIVSSLHVVTEETQRYAFLLFSVIMSGATGLLFPFSVSCLRHATSCSHKKFFCIKLISCIKFGALYSKRNSFYLFEKWRFMI